MSRFAYLEKPHWPPLAWLAECTANEHSLRIHHGPGIEIGRDWFCEAVWDGDFEAGDFDRTDIVFGSGGRARGDRVVFVSSGSTVDRLQFFRQGDTWLISNSLACLHATTKGWPSAEYPSFPEFFTSIIEGLNQYERIVPEAGPTLVYFRNLAWDGRALEVIDKLSPPRDLSCFHGYRGVLHQALCGLGDNMRHGRRRHKLDWLGTISSGYDSPTVAVLAQPAGLRRAISFVSAREGNDDNGQEIASRLGLEVIGLDRLAWREVPMTEVPFLAADAKGEDILFAGAREHLRNRVLLTGYHGDKVWEKTTSVLTPDIVRGDQSGLSLTEYRLLVGMLHAPVPFIGVRSIREINAVSHREEMRSWDIGGDYNRPICRRILEEAGVPRHLFGQHKKAASNLFQRGETCFTPEARADYRSWRRSEG